MGDVQETPPRGEPRVAGGSPAGDRWGVVVVALVALAVLMRLNNGVRFPSLHGYDSFGHVTYIWYLLKTGRVPLADQGWSFFHPPLYYALAAAIWAPLRDWDPKQVLKLLSVTFSLIGLASAWVSFRVATAYFPDNRLARWSAPLFVLFLPAGLYTTPMLGNEGLNAVLCSAALYVLIRTLRDPTRRNAVLLGVVLGAALLTKATAAAIAAAAVVSLIAWAMHTRRWRLAATNLGLTLAVAGTICGWYYARNVMHFGTPLAMSRGYFVVEHVENAFPQGDRGPLAYLTFDPHIFVEPRFVDRPVINSVWTGLFAGAWFEVVGASFAPPPPDDAHVWRVGQLLIALGVVPTLVLLVGLGSALRRLWRQGWDDTLVPLLIGFAMTVAAVIAHTHRVPTFTAVKTSYLLPAIVPLSLWFALGLDALRRWRLTLALVLAECAVLLAVIVPMFTYQLVFAADVSAFYFNALGSTYYLAGFRDSAKEIFAPVASGYHLAAAYESLAAVALDEGKLDEALRHLQQAMELAPEQAFAVGEDRLRLQQANQAEYRSTEAYLYHLLGQDDRAVDAARWAVAQGPDIPEAHYNLAALLVASGAVDAGAAAVRHAIERDATFTEAYALLAVAEARRGNCGGAIEELRRVAHVCRPTRAYPWQTGRGDILDTGLARRRIIDLCSSGLDPYGALRACSAEPGAQGMTLAWLPVCRRTD